MADVCSMILQTGIGVPRRIVRNVVALKDGALCISDSSAGSLGDRALDLPHLAKDRVQRSLNGLAATCSRSVPSATVGSGEGE